MIAIEIKNTKELMEAIFSQNLFEGFLITEATITMDYTVRFDGYKVRDDSEKSNSGEMAVAEGTPYAAQEDTIYWKEIRTIAREVLVGGGRPRKVKLVFRAPASGAANIIKRYDIALLPEEIMGMFMNITYDGAKTICTTGVSVRDFLKGKAVENAWDQRVSEFMKRFGGE